jgi:hypothetical protein
MENMGAISVFLLEQLWPLLRTCTLVMLHKAGPPLFISYRPYMRLVPYLPYMAVRHIGRGWCDV